MTAPTCATVRHWCGAWSSYLPWGLVGAVCAADARHCAAWTIGWNCPESALRYVTVYDDRPRHISERSEDMP